MTHATIDWHAEQDRFMEVAYPRALGKAKTAFKKWHSRKREDAESEMIGKMWDQWARLLTKGKDPEPMLWPLIHWAIMWVRYDRKIGGRARSYDVLDYRAGMKRQDLDGQGLAHPADRSDPNNSWIEWALASGDDPAEMAAALEQAGITVDNYMYS